MIGVETTSSEWMHGDRWLPATATLRFEGKAAAAAAQMLVDDDSSGMPRFATQTEAIGRLIAVGGFMHIGKDLDHAIELAQDDSTAEVALKEYQGESTDIDVILERNKQIEVVRLGMGVVALANQVRIFTATLPETILQAKSSVGIYRDRHFTAEIPQDAYRKFDQKMAGPKKLGLVARSYEHVFSSTPEKAHGISIILQGNPAFHNVYENTFDERTDKDGSLVVQYAGSGAIVHTVNGMPHIQSTGRFGLEEIADISAGQLRTYSNSVTGLQGTGILK